MIGLSKLRLLFGLQTFSAGVAQSQDVNVRDGVVNLKLSDYIKGRYIDSENKLCHAISNHLNKGYKVSVYCGLQGFMLGRYALTRPDNRINADLLKDGFIKRLSRETGKKIKVEEEIRGTILRRYIYIVFTAEN